MTFFLNPLLLLITLRLLSNSPNFFPDPLNQTPYFTKNLKISDSTPKNSTKKSQKSSIQPSKKKIKKKKIKKKTLTKTESKIKNLRKKLQKNPKNLSVRKKLTKALISIGNNKEAISTLSPYLNELSPFYLKLLEKAHLREKNYKEQHQILKLLILNSKDKPESKLFFRLGESLLKIQTENQKSRIKNETQAIQHFRKSIELNPKYKPPYDALIDLFKKNKYFYEALLIVQDRGQQFKKDLSHYALLCELYAKRKIKVETIENCNQAIKLNPKEPNFYFHQMKAYSDSGDDLTIKKMLIQLVKIFPKSHIVHETVGKHYLKEKEFNLAYEYLKKAVRMKPDSSSSQLAFAKAAFELGQYQQSLHAFLRVCHLSRQIPLEFKLASSRLRKNHKNKNLAHTFSLNLQKCHHKKRKKAQK